MFLHKMKKRLINSNPHHDDNAGELVERSHVYIGVQFGSETDEPVMIPVDDAAIIDTPEGRETVFRAAWRFYHHSQLVREATNASFIERLARNLPQRLRLPEMLNAIIVQRLGQHYLERLQQEAPTQGERLVDANAKHLRLEGQGTESQTIVIDPPAGWEQVALERCRKLTDKAINATHFTNWLWGNQLTWALTALEDQRGEDTLEGFSNQEFNEQLIATAFEQPNSGMQLGQLTMDYVRTTADNMLNSIVATKSDLWTFELFLGFRDFAPTTLPQPSGRIIPVDFRALLPKLSARPDDLYQLHSRQFEELIAHLFEGFGYEVQLTPATNDGGFDIMATRRAETNIRILIECKRYTPPHKVGRPIVQQLLGVINDRQQHATKAILATTSIFTPPATELLTNNHWRIEGRDHDAILKWITQVQAKNNMTANRSCKKT